MKKIIFIILLLSSIFSNAQKSKQIESNNTNKNNNVAKETIGVKKEPIDPGDITGPIVIDPISPIGPIGPIEPEPIDPFGLDNVFTDNTEVGVTNGELSVSLSGAANYTIPISMPPGINGVIPQISLNYNSQSSDGNVGYCWNIGGVSRISRIPTTIYHDGVIDPVDFDNLDRFALDGQRLILKTGTYGMVGSTYETENFSNVKVSLLSNGNFQSYFKVEYPDGSTALYGYSNTISTFNSLIEWPITEWQNAQSIRVNYTYYNYNNEMHIKSIVYGTNTISGINIIEFSYKNKSKETVYYVGGIEYKRNKILSSIKIKGNNVPFRNYYLNHDLTSTRNERLISIQEKTGDNTKSLNPTVFTYNDNQTIFNQTVSYSNTGSNITINDLSNSVFIKGDFTGMGKIEFLSQNNESFKLSSIDENYNTITNINQNIPCVSRSLQGPIKTLNSDLQISNKDYFGFFYGGETISNIFHKSFKVYSHNSFTNTFNLEYEKKIDANYVTGNEPLGMRPWNIVRDTGLYRDYSFVGDFNGDKISDMLFLKYRNGIINIHMINLDRRASVNSNFAVGTINVGATSYVFSPNNENGNLTIKGTSDIKVGDYNGDGKLDLFVLSGAPHNKISIYSLVGNNFTLLESINFILPNNIGDDYSRNNRTPGIVINKLYIADFNGDGKSDIFMPFLAKILISRPGYGSFRETLMPSSFSKPTTPYMESYEMEDVNSDGKLDVLILKPILESQISSSQQTVQLGSSPWYTPGGSTPIYQTTIYNGYKYNFGLSLKLYQQKDEISSLSWEESSFSRMFKIQFGGVDQDPSDDNQFNYNRIPIFIRKKSNNPMYNELAIMGGRLTYFNFKRHSDEQILLKSITLGNGVSNNIVYNNLVDGNGTYTKHNNLETYPYFNLLNGKYNKVVSEISQSFSGYFFKKRIFNYSGATFDVSGRGVGGFQSTMATNWFNDNSKIISNITKFDFSKQGAPKVSFSILGLFNANYNLLPSDIFIKKSLFTYNYEDTSYENPNLQNKVFKLYKTKTENYNGLNNTSSIANVLYNANKNPYQVTTLIKNGTTIEKKTVANSTYSPLISTPYILDRPLSKTVTTTIFPSNDVSSTEEKYEYDTTLLKKIEKRSTNSGQTTPYITEQNEYDIYGNITQKKLSTTGMIDRISSFEYDPTTHRFVTKKTDIEGLITEYTYDLSTGFVKTETLPSNSSFPLKTTFLYDKWGKKIGSKDYLGNSETISYGNFYNGVIVGTNSRDGKTSRIIKDVLGRTIQVATKGFEGDWSLKTTEYDINDKPIKISEPYYGTLGDFTEYTVWNEMQYDVYGRLIQANSLKDANTNGKKTTYVYNVGLTVTENDGIKTKVTTTNASDNIISISESPTGTTISYDYFANSNLKSTTSSGAVTTILQDGWGKRKQLNDPSAGIFNYSYNNFGELTSEEVLGKGTTTYNLNDKGKLVSKTIVGNGVDLTNTSTTYTYDDNTKLLSSILFNDITNNYSLTNTFGYNDYNILNQTTEVRKNSNTDIFKFQKDVEFDSFGRPKKEIFSALDYASGLKSEKSVRNEYNTYGYNSKIINDSDNIVLWEINKVNASGEILTAFMTEGRKLSKTYDDFGFPTQIKVDKLLSPGGNLYNNLMTFDTQFDPIYGNLTSRSNNLFGSWTENLTYDELDRLKNYKNTTGVQTQTYNGNGTIASNNIGDYAYTITDKPFQVSTITPVVPSAVYNYYSAREQNIKYNVFKSPVSISELTKENIDFEYNSNNSRTAMYYGGLQPLKNNRPYKKYYSADGSMEITYKTSAPNSLDFVTYIGGDGYSAPIVLKSNGTTQEYLYLHRDYQGSILAISNSLGVVVEKRLFDVWGSLIQYANSAGINTVPTSNVGMLLDRGYTGHEHLLGVGLINMNGRVYDDKLHKFLQPDNNIQDPYNTQNFNRYAYGLNNPTKYTDESGEFWGLVLGYLFSTYVHGAQATGEANPLKWNAGEFANAAMGASSILISNFATNVLNDNQNNGNRQEGLTNNVVTSSNNIEGHEYVVNEYDNSDFVWASSASLVLLADDPATGGVGVVDDILIPVLYGVAGGMWITKNWIPLTISAKEGINTITELANPNSGAFKYVTYTKTNAEGLVYVGRSSGFGTPEQIVMNRDREHHMGKSMIGPLNLKDFGPAKLSTWVASTTGGYSFRAADPSYWAIRGAEQLQINYHTIQGNSANARAGIYEFNRNIDKYMEWGKNLLGF